MKRHRGLMRHSLMRMYIVMNVGGYGHLNPSLTALNMVYRLPVVGVSVSTAS